MKLILFFLSLMSFHALSADGLTIPNSFQVDKHGAIFRGKEPKGLVTELAQIGITDVVIFKNEVKDEVRKEQLALKELGIRSYHIPFQWKNYESMDLACAQVIDALKIIRTVKVKGGSVFFHCTAGEDRTGMLAGLYRMLEENISTEEAFRTEMCARGYSDGNYKKPALVTSAIQKELTPLFLALSEKVRTGVWRLDRLSKTSCRNLQVAPTALRCRVKN